MSIQFKFVIKIDRIKPSSIYVPFNVEVHEQIYSCSFPQLIQYQMRIIIRLSFNNKSPVHMAQWTRFSSITD